MQHGGALQYCCVRLGAARHAARLSESDRQTMCEFDRFDCVCCLLSPNITDETRIFSTGFHDEQCLSGSRRLCNSSHSTIQRCVVLCIDCRNGVCCETTCKVDDCTESWFVSLFSFSAQRLSFAFPFSNNFKPHELDSSGGDCASSNFRSGQCKWFPFVGGRLGDWSLEFANVSFARCNSVRCEGYVHLRARLGSLHGSRRSVSLCGTLTHRYCLCRNFFPADSACTNRRSTSLGWRHRTTWQDGCSVSTSRASTVCHAGKRSMSLASRRRLAPLCIPAFVVVVVNPYFSSCTNASFVVSATSWNRL